jgi:hypothetical protein
VDSVFEQRTEEWKQVFKEKQGIDRSYHEFPVLYGMPAVPEIPDGTAVTYSTFGQAYIYRIVYKVYGMGFALTKILVEDGDHIRIGTIGAEQLAQAYVETEEVLCANILNRAFNSAYTYGDGVSLVAPNHPLIIGGTYSNLLATPAALSQTSLEQMLIQIRNAVDYTNKRIRVTPLKIVTGPSNVMQADVLLKTVLRAGGALNDPNPVLSLKMLPEGQANLSRITSTTMWGIQTDAAGSPGFIMLTRRRQEKATEGDFETDSMKFKVTGRYQPGNVETARSFYATPGLAVAGLAVAAGIMSAVAHLSSFASALFC